MKYKVTVIGAGYVGMSLSVLFAKKHDVTLYDIDDKKISLIQQNKSPVKDADLQDVMNKKELSINVTSSKNQAFNFSSHFYIIATPTDYDEKLGSFDTSSVESVIDEILAKNLSGLIVIKSTVPVGFTEKMQNKHKSKDIIFSPEFLREGQAYSDNLYPSRIIIGGKGKNSKIFGSTLAALSLNDSTPIFYMNSSEAESVKLFSNTFLALRVAFFNELDSFALEKNMNSKNIIEGVSSDPRIGNYYNNPSFGYGGYCLPKDTKQLLANYEQVPQNIIESIIKANDTRKNFIAKKIIELSPKCIGVYKLSMKTNSDNSRQSSIIDVINILASQKLNILIFESQPFDNENNLQITTSFDEFIDKCDVIITNRLSSELNTSKAFIFSRDLFGYN